MSKKSFFVVSSSYKESFNIEEPILFLGSWCEPKKEFSFDKEFEILTSLPLKKTQKDEMFNEARNFQAKISKILFGVLNRHHKKKFTDREWKILIGHWVRRATETLLNRVNLVNTSINSYNLIGTHEIVNYDLSTTDSLSFIHATNDDKWNLAINAAIFRSYVKDERFFNKINSDILKVEIKYPKHSKVKVFISKILSFFTKKNDRFFIGEYFSSFLLQLSYFQIPQFPITPVIKKRGGTNYEIRNKLSKEFLREVDRLKLENSYKIICSLIFDIIPQNYLEDLKLIDQLSKNLNWPKEPKYIFTSNDFDTNDVFKYWLITKMRKGSQYFVGQHGNNYKTHKYLAFDTIEEQTSDKFVTWGWKGKGKNYEKGFIFNSIKTKTHKKNTKQILLILRTLERREVIWDSYDEYLKYFESICIFLNYLKKNTIKNFLVRLHKDNKTLNVIDDEKRKLMSIHNKINIDDGVSDIGYLFNTSALIIHGYDSTGVLQTLSKNLPTLIFCSNGIDYLNDSSIKYYQLLIDAGILYTNPHSLAKKIERVSGDVDEWWASKDIQIARKEFCSQYANTSSNHVVDLKKILGT